MNAHTPPMTSAIFLEDDTICDPATGEIRSLEQHRVASTAPAPNAPIVEFALYYARLGWHVFPCGRKVPLTACDKDANGNKIRGTGGFYKATTDQDQIRAWWRQFPRALIGVRAGPESGIFVIDLDGADGIANWSTTVAKNSAVPQTHMHLTPGGGQHLVFKWREDRPVTNSPGQLKGLKIDVRGKGGYFIAPPSLAKNGKRYEIADPLNFFKFAEAPDWLYEILKKPEAPAQSITERAKATIKPPTDHYAVYGAESHGTGRGYIEAALLGEYNILAAMPSNSGRNIQLNDSSLKLGHYVGGGLLDEKRVIDTMMDACAANGLLADGKAQCLATIMSGMEAGKLQPKGIPERRSVSSHDGAHADGGVNPKPALPPIVATPFVLKDPTTLPRRLWLYGKLLLRKFVSASISPGSVGKSSLIAAEALAMVSGKDLLGVKPAERLRVWLWNLEDPQEETERKIGAAALHYELGPDDIGDRLMVDSGRNQRLVIARTERNNTVIVQPVVDALVAEIIRLKIDVLIIDPFVSCHEVAENDNGGMDMVVKEWGRVAERGNVAVHLVHHTRKMSGGETEVTVDSGRGASSQTDGFRVVRTLNRMTKDQAKDIGVENPWLYFRTANGKPNLEPPIDKSDWYKLVSVDLGNGEMGTGDSMGVVTEWEYPAALAGMTAADFDKVAIVIRGGKWRESPQAKDWVGKAVAKALNLDINDRAHKGKIRRALGAWYKAKSLVAVDGFDDRRNPRTFVEVAED